MTRIAIFGAAGYGGIELLRILLAHPEVEITYLGGRTTAGQDVTDMYPHLLGSIKLPIEETSVEVACERADLLFFALPHGVGIPMVAEAVRAGKKVVDFSADFRLKDVTTYEAYYQPHDAPQLLSQAAYGLPELHRDTIRDTTLCAVPGCYPTGAILALAPAVMAGLIEADTIIIDSKTGISGAGRSKLDLLYHFPEANESLLAYAVGTHRHTPEMDQELSLLAGSQITVTFTPHLIPITRGILSTCYATFAQGTTLDQAQNVYEEFYAEEPFVQVLPAGKLPRTKHVSGSNFCHIGLAEDVRTSRLVVVSAVDNLIKGLSGSACQCMNLMMGWDETTALDQPGMWP